MKLSFLAFLFVFFYSRPTVLSAQINKAIFGKTILIRSGDIRFDSLLHQLARQTGVEFSFSANRIGAASVVRNSRPKQSLANWLQVLEQSLGIRYKVVGNHIILYEVGRTGNTVSPRTKDNTRRANAEEVTPRRPHSLGDSSRPVQAPSLPTRADTDHTEVTVPVHSTAWPAARLSILVPAASANTVTATTPVAPANGPSAVVSAMPGRPDDVSTQSMSVAPTASNRPAPAPAAKPAQAPVAPVPARQPKPSARRTAGYDPVKVAGLEALQLFAGWSRNSSGDMEGISFATTYSNYLSNRFSLNLDVRGLINWNQFDIVELHPVTRQFVDGSVRFTTASAQLGVLAGWSLVQVPQHELKINLGPLGRFQSASNGDDGYSLYSPLMTGLPTSLIGYENRTPQNKFTVGYLLSLQYQFILNNKMTLGLAAVYQNDTNGDMIPQAGITVGKRF